MTDSIAAILDAVLEGQLPSDQQALALAGEQNTRRLTEVAATLRDRGFHNVVTYSRKVFIPLTHLCRDVCHYCTFAQTPKKLQAPFLTIDQVLEIARSGAEMGCKEALFTLGEKPELRYKAAREALAEMGFATTLEYLHHAAQRVVEETGLLPHLNPGNMTQAELDMLRPVAPSMGIMLESSSRRLTEKGMPHYGSPDKDPAVRLETLELAGRNKVPFTSGILIGIGETRRERIESLLAIREIHQRHGHIQEIIVQNFRAKPDTKMAQAPEPDLNELLWTIAVARIVFGPLMSIQAPPNLSPGVLSQIVAAGINDWGGVSPVTPDFVNPEAPWPHLDELNRETAVAGKHLHERLTIYPNYASEISTWVDPGMHTRLLHMIDAEGFPRVDDWCPGDEQSPPQTDLNAVANHPSRVSEDLQVILKRAAGAVDLCEAEIVRLFGARGDDFSAVVQAADALRTRHNGDRVTYVVNRNINYTNICYFKCQFCAFSKGKLSENLRGRPYDLSHEEIQRRCEEAWARGGTEVCMQGGIHPEYTGETYVEIVKAVKRVTPDMHVHAFSPLEIWQGAATLNLPLDQYLRKLLDAGLDTLPGTAAEILDDEVRETLCPDKINTEQWLRVMETAHELGIRTTATIMYGHVDQPQHWARHLIRVRDLQKRTSGFTEFVPLPFVHMEAPLYLKGKARKGPTFREAVLMHAVARLTLNPYITNIQASWVKMGHQGVIACLNAGCNDLGGTLMNESITRAAGASHGQETSPQRMIEMIEGAHRVPAQRNTVYGEVPRERIDAGLGAGELEDIINTPARKYERKRSGPLIRRGVVEPIQAVNLN
ncbi:MAG: 7,8-didemethyl-8-hydroxy-5-deazariboflavin synthase subunit CofH [Gammaproteobacteria bacterium]|nr:MAG: 7,8-didemethyl-8-hydroxy-5-deazariboflavin synthase subunit CofH [Gammaproteobacteria bacterium]